MELGKRRKTKIQIFGIFCFVTLMCYLVFTNEGFIEFLDALKYRMSEFQPYLSHDISDVKLLLWTRKNRNNAVYLNMSSAVSTYENFNM